MCACHSIAILGMVSVSRSVYFTGLWLFMDNVFAQVFLNPFKSSVQQLVEPKAFQWVLHFGVKYYVPEPHYIKDEHTRWDKCCHGDMMPCDGDNIFLQRTILPPNPARPEGEEDCVGPR